MIDNFDLAITNQNPWFVVALGKPLKVFSPAFFQCCHWQYSSLLMSDVC